MTRNRVITHLSQAKQSVTEGNRKKALESVKKALAADPGEMVITEVLLSMERSEYDLKHNSEEPDSNIKSERNNAAVMDLKLEKALRLSDEALAAGNDAKALAYLKKAAQLFPDEPEVNNRMQEFKNRIKAGKLVKIGLKKLSEGDISKAVLASRRAFDLFPEAAGIGELLSRIETAESSSPVKEKPQPVKTVVRKTPEPEPENEIQIWAEKIRSAVKENDFEGAGKMISEAVKIYPNDSLLNSFHTKLKRLGFTS